jgi:hypothetical protein
MIRIEIDIGFVIDSSDETAYRPMADKGLKIHQLPLSGPTLEAL